MFCVSVFRSRDDYKESRQKPSLCLGVLLLIDGSSARLLAWVKQEERQVRTSQSFVSCLFNTSGTNVTL